MWKPPRRRAAKDAPGGTQPSTIQPSGSQPTAPLAQLPTTQAACPPEQPSPARPPAMPRDSTVVASKCAKVVAGAGSVRSSAGT